MMLNSPQGTLVSPIEFRGPGLHTAKNHCVKIIPASVNHGIVFVKKGKKVGGAEKLTRIPAHWQSVTESPLCTCLAAENGERVRTVEHLLAAFYACGIDNALVEVEGSEIPVLDGSAKVFIQKIDEIGVNQQDQSRVIHKVIQKTTFVEGKRFITIEPADKYSLDITISLSHFGRLHWSGEITPEVFKREMSSARTFGRLKNGLLAQLSRFSKEPVCLGANKQTALVLDSKTKVLNKGGLRMDDEIIYHRVLDVVGDMMLAGGHMQGKVTANSTAHRLNYALLKSLFTQKHIETYPVQSLRKV